MSLQLTYNQLRTMMTDWTDNDDPEYEQAQDRIISLSELKVLRDLDLTIFDVEDAVTVATAIGVNTIARPSDMLSEMNLSYPLLTETINMEPRQYSWLKEFGSTSTDNPLYYAVKNLTEWLIAPTPDAVYPITIEYIKRPDGLTSSNSETWMGNNVADLLFYACLINSEEFIEASEMLPQWNTKYNELLAAAKSEFKEHMRVRY